MIRCFLLLHSEEVWARTLISSDLSGEKPAGSKRSENEGFDKGLHSVKQQTEERCSVEGEKLALSVNGFNADKPAKLHLIELQVRILTLSL